MNTLQSALTDCLRAHYAELVGFASAERFRELGVYELLPEAKSVVGVAFRVLRGAHRGLENGTTFYQYPASLQCIEETVMPLALLAACDALEEAGFTALPQRRQQLIAGDAQSTNPEIYAESIYHGLPSEAQFDFTEAAVRCQLGERGHSGALLTDEFGPFQRLCFLLTDAPFEPTPTREAHLCDQCGLCAQACPGRAISESGTLDAWQCAAYYQGLHRDSNPFMPEDALADEPDREAILCGAARLTPEDARRLMRKTRFYGGASNRYAPCLCERACDVACYCHLEAKGVLTRKFARPFRPQL